MIFTKALPYNEIKEKLSKTNDVITVIGCQSCVRASGCGGEKKMKELALSLRQNGYNVKDGFSVLASCTPKVLFVKLDSEVNTILSLSCSAGTANVKRCFPKHKVVETTAAIGLMLADSDKKILKVTMSYQDYPDEKGKEYGLCTGEKMDSNNNLLTMEGNQ